MNDDANLPVAAVDLGSNSFHMVIGRVIGDELSVLDRLRDPVRLAAGLDDRGNLSEDAVERMLASLQRFGQRLVDLPPSRVRAIGTAALRKTRRPKDVLARAGNALGHPIELLSGAEEARLIFLGVAHGEAQVQGNRLVVDVGGASTESILGEGFTPIFADSLAMGCVTWSRRFFPDGRVGRKAFKEAEVAAQLELEPLQQRFRRRGWSDCVGSSGTAGAVAQILLESGWSEGAITLAGLKKLRRAMIDAGSVDALDVPGGQAERKPVLPGGVAILRAVFESLGIESMRYSKAALREGVLYDLLGRIRHEDVRDRTIRALSERYHVDNAQAASVESTALVLLHKTADAWGLDREEGGQLLGWAARVHEIGLAIAYPGHHKHGAYILENANLPGFSRQEQQRLSALVRGHRRKLAPDVFEALSERWRQAAFRLCILLRLAVRFERTRRPQPLPAVHVDARADGLDLRLPTAWLESHPLTRADLEDEGKVLESAGFRLRVEPDDSLPAPPAE